MNNYYSRISDIESFLFEKYEFRYNDVLGRTEYRNKNNEGNKYQKVNDYFANTLLRELSMKGLSYPKDSLINLLKSDFAPKYNSLRNYFNDLPEWDGVDYIAQLASTISTTNDELFLISLSKWLVGTVASVMNDETINHIMLIFIGKQGVGKSSWIKGLVPEDLKEYYYEGMVYPKDKDSRIQLSERMVINIDELGVLNSRDLEMLKDLITNGSINVRRVYARHSESMTRIASFVGSGNHKEFLSDTTGNRRFLCFDVKGVNYKHEVPIGKVYSQAVHLYRSGFQHWLDGDEISLVNENNEDFTSHSVEEDLLLKYLEPCPKEDGTLFDSATGILKKLLELDNPSSDGKPNNGSRINTPSVVALGKMLNKHGFSSGKKKGMKVYYYREKQEKVVVEVEEVIYGYGYYRERKKVNKKR